MVGFTPDVGASFYAEGEEIDLTTPALAQHEVKTHKVAALVQVSNELDRAGNATNALSDGMRRGLARKANQSLFNNADAPTGILNDANMADAVALGENLDSFNAAYWGIAEDGVTPNFIVASPSAMSALGSLKEATGSNAPLVDDMTVMGLPVYVSTAMAADRFLMGHTSATVSAVGKLRVAKSLDAAFAYDSLVLRCTWRFGFKVVRPERLAVIATA